MDSEAEQLNFVLIRGLDEGQVEWIPLDAIPAREPAAAGADYALVDRAIYEAPETLVARRDGDDLAIDVQGTEVLVLEGFFTRAETAFYPTTDIAGGAGPFSQSPLTPGTAVIAGSGEQVVWSAEPADAGAVATGEGDEGGTSPMLWGGLGLGGLALAAAAGGGGGGGGGDDGGGGTPPPATPEPTSTTVSGLIVAGPVVSGHGLTAEVYQADGTTLLGTATVDADGSFSVDVGDYTGAVIINVIDADDGPDYLDEATDGPRDLNAALSAAQDVDGSGGTLAVNVNPLTTLAAALAQREAGEGAPTAAQVDSANAAIADLFGVSNLHGTTVSAINGGAYDADDGLSAEEHYGAVLAMFSGATLNNGGDSQQTLDDVLAAITVSDDGQATLSDAAQQMLIEGAETTENETGQSLGNVTAALDNSAPEITSGDTATAIPENSGAGQLVYTATGTDNATITWSLDGPDAGDFSIDADSGEVVITENPDFETKSSYSFAVVATDPAGNSTSQDVTLSITDQDDSAPSITSGAIADPIDENSGDDQVVYTGTVRDDEPVTWSLADTGDAADFSIDAQTGAVTLEEDPDHESQSSYEFTVVATDQDGNTGTQDVSLTINDLDEVAPTITSGGTAGPLVENSGAGQVVYRTASTDEDAASDTSTMYSLAGDDAAAFEVDARTGVVTLTDNPNFEANSRYDFTVVATDAGGNSAEQAVTLTITNVDEVAPTITSATTADVDENSGANQVVYRVTSTDTDVVSGSTTYSLGPGGDRSDFNINSQTGVVRLIEDPDFESQPSYTFTVVATDGAGNSSERQVTLTVNDLDEVAPTITSGATADPIDENSGNNQVVYTATANEDVTWSLSGGGDSLRINANDGRVRLTVNPDFEDQSSYTFTVVATDADGNRSVQTVTLNINNVDEVAPVITSGASAGSVDEDSGAGQVIYTVTSTDDGDISSGATTYSLTSAGDGDEFDIDPSSGEVTLIENPDFEAQPSYTFTVRATDAAGNSSTQAVTLTVNDQDDDPPEITSGDTADPIDENSGEDQVVYTATADEPVTWELADTGDGDEFDIDTDSGAVTLTEDPDFEEQPSYTFTVIATDADGNSSDLDVTLEILDVDDEDDDDDDVPGIEASTTLAVDAGADSGTVVFDLVAGSSSDHSGRTFQSDVSYDIYIRVDGDSASLNSNGGDSGSWDTWSGASNLGSDDRVMLVGDGGTVLGLDGGPVSGVDVGSTSVAWETAGGDAARLQGASFGRLQGADAAELVLFETSLPSAFLGAQGGRTSTMYFTNMPAGVLTSQGLV